MRQCVANMRSRKFVATGARCCSAPLAESQALLWYTRLTTHAAAPNVCVDSGALLAAQASLTALPDELLVSILRRAWAETPWTADAAGEVRAAAGLACVCRRWRALLRAQPLPLALDFSGARLSAAQRRWLLNPAQAGRVEAADFFVAWRSSNYVCKGSQAALWEQPVCDDFLARHGSTLLHLSGVPLRLVAPVSQGVRPALDLSGLRLTRLGLDCWDIAAQVDHGTWAQCWWLWPECLPGALEELELLDLHDQWLVSLAWAPRSGAGLAERLPRLHTLRVTCVQFDNPSIIGEVVPLLDGFTTPPHFEVFSEKNVSVSSDLFARVRSVRIVAGSCVSVWAHRQDAATIVDRLCTAGLQAAELCAQDCICMDPSPGLLIHEVVRELINRHSDRYAVEVGFFYQLYNDNEEYCPTTALFELAWRRWPVHGTPGLQAARAAHESARAWVANIEVPQRLV